MFEVIWTDPNRESVGERKNRKNAEQTRRKKEENRLLQKSTQSTSSASVDTPLPGVFGNYGSGNQDVQSHETAGPAALRSDSAASGSAGRRDSFFGSPLSHVSSSGSRRQRPVRFVDDGPSYAQTLDEFSETSLGLGSRDSIFSKPHRQPTASPPVTPASVFGGSHRPLDSNSKVVQTLGPGSSIVKTTEVISTPRSPGLDLERLLSDVTISADPGAVPRATSPPPTELPKSVQTKNWLSSIPNTARPLSPQLRESRLGLGPLPMPRHKIPSTPRGPRIPVVASPDSVFQNEHPDSWKPPDTWDCSPAPKPVITLTSMDAMLKTRTEQHTRKSASFSMDLGSLQREMKMMEAATPQTILTRLKEQWDDSKDPAVYQETVMEKQRWMLSAMYNVDRPGIDGSKEESAMVPGIRDKDMKILALFESQATASYLAAAHADSFIYHMSPTPISNDLFPNVLPSALPIVSHASLSVAPDMFSAVYCLSLPSLVASSEIPPLLRTIHRTLAPGGAAHLTLIDPAPVPQSLGPRMRLWLEENLQMNLERKFRCIHPRKLVPGWMADAHLRGACSTITTVKFFAIPPAHETSTSHATTTLARVTGASTSTSVCGTDDGTASSIGSLSSAKAADIRVRTELRSVVGRMLWREVWGKYITGSNWWWDDPLCVKECQEMGTHWIYEIIVGIKESAQPSQ
ncbi:hypothetical protein RB596_005901 [Gaeumannomyces avenae]